MVDIQKIKDLIKSKGKDFLTLDELIDIGIFPTKTAAQRFNSKTQLLKKYAFYQANGCYLFKINDLMELFNENRFLKYLERTKKQKKPNTKAPIKNPIVTIENLINDFKNFLVGKYVHGNNV